MCTADGYPGTGEESVLDYVMFRVMGTEYESENVYKQVFITVKGVLA